MWDSLKKGFKAYLSLEKSLSDNSVEAYLRDLEKLTIFLEDSVGAVSPGQVDLAVLQRFIKWLAELGMTPASQARIISGIKGFYKFCLLEQVTEIDPTALLESPKLSRKLPD